MLPQSPNLGTALQPISAAILCTGGLYVIQKEARLFWELDELKVSEALHG